MRDRFGQIDTPPVQHCPFGSYYDPDKGVCVPYTVPRTSALALDMLKLSLRENSAALGEVGISVSLARPNAGTKLYYTVYDLIVTFAMSLLRQSVPFYYETVAGEMRAVQSTTQADAAIDYLPQTMKLWGYVRTTEVPQPDTEPPLRVTPVELDIEEEKVILWAVSRSLGEMGIPSYPLLTGRKEGVALSERKFAFLLNRAIYIAEQMVQQNTYSPRL